MRIFSKKNLVNYLLLLIIVIIFFNTFDSIAALKTLKEVSIPLLLLSAAIYLFQQPLRGLRFASILSPLGVSLPKKRNLATHLITPLLARVTPGKIGEGAKVFMLPVDKKMLALGFIVEKLHDFIILILFAAPIALLVSELRLAFVIFVGLFIAGIIALWFSDPLLSLLAKVGSKISPLKIEFPEKWFSKHIHQMGAGHAILLLIQGIIIWSINFIALYILAKSIMISISPIAFISLMAVSILIGVVSGLPGGFGAREASLAFLLIRFGVTETNAAAYSLLLVSFILLVEGVGALLGWVLYRQTINQE